MSLLSNTGVGEEHGGFYNNVATQSLRLDGGSQITLDNADAATSNKIATISTWFKRADETTTLAYLFHSKNDGSFGDGSNGLASFSITLDADDGISVIQYNGNPSFGADQYDFGVKIQNRKFRDMSSWYHLVVAIDTTQGSGTTNEADRIKIYINGTQQTVVAITDGSGYQDFADENQLVAVNQDGEQRWGGTVDDGTYAHVYLAETNVVDGLQLDASYFGETKNGVWIAKNPSVSEYGNHGYRLQYKLSAVGTGSSSTIGADTSGKTNHFTSTGVAAHDCAMPDSPENNFCTLNPVHGAAAAYDPNQFVLKEGSLHLYNASASNTGTCSTFLMESGKWYWEIFIKDTNSTYNHHIGVVNGASFIEPATAPKAIYRNDGIVYYTNTSGSDASNTSPSGMTAGEVWACAFDADNNTIKFYVGGSQTGDTISLLSPGSLGWKTYAATGQASADNSYWNYGQDPTFANEMDSSTAAKTPSNSGAGTADGNDNGKFFYAPPSGYLALCSANLPDTGFNADEDNQPSNFFKTTSYAGTNDATRTFDLGFVSDWAWFKADADGYGHQIYDSSRGAQKYVRSNSNALEATNSDGLLDFDDSGTLLKIGTDPFLNESGTDMALWTWRVNGGTTSTNSDGSADSTVQVNQTLGMSQVLYTGNATGAGAEQTIGHGLGVIPDVIMFKGRDYSGGYQEWYIHHNQLANGVTTHIELNETAAEHADADYMNAVTPTNSVFSLGYNFTTNESGSAYIAYCFKSIVGYSKFGSWIGSGSTSGNPGPYIYLGFRPAWVMVKRFDSTGNWWILDSVRDPFNEVLRAFQANETNDATDYSGNFLDFYSNGFGVRTSGAEVNAENGTYLYFAFAEMPFKHANAR
jgi:hypothetical protein